MRIDDPTGEALVNRGGIADRIYATISQPSYFACVAESGTLEDSVCWSTGSNGIGAGTNTSTATPLNPKLRNVTAIGSGSGGVGLSYEAQIGTTLTVDGLNVIAHGAGGTDVAAIVNGGNSSTINLDYSNFATRLMQGVGASATHPGLAHNQMAAPMFTWAPTGDFHEATGSPTINAGVAASDLGPSDLDGLARIEQGTPDIGAYEVHPPAATAPVTHRKCKKHKKHGRATSAKKRCKKHKHR